MTMYPSYVRKGRDMILYFLKKHFNDPDNLIIPMKPLKIVVAEPQEYQYNADAFENYLRDNAANDNKNKEIIMQK